MPRKSMCVLLILSLVISSAPVSGDTSSSDGRQSGLSENPCRSLVNSPLESSFNIISRSNSITESSIIEFTSIDQARMTTIQSNDLFGEDANCLRQNIIMASEVLAMNDRISSGKATVLADMASGNKNLSEGIDALNLLALQEPIEFTPLQYLMGDTYWSELQKRVDFENSTITDADVTTFLDLRRHDSATTDIILMQHTIAQANMMPIYLGIFEPNMSAEEIEQQSVDYFLSTLNDCKSNNTVSTIYCVIGGFHGHPLLNKGFTEGLPRTMGLSAEKFYCFDESQVVISAAVSGPDSCPEGQTAIFEKYYRGTECQGFEHYRGDPNASEIQGLDKDNHIWYSGGIQCDDYRDAKAPESWQRSDEGRFTLGGVNQLIDELMVYNGTEEVSGFTNLRGVFELISHSTDLSRSSNLTGTYAENRNKTVTGVRQIQSLPSFFPGAQSNDSLILNFPPIMKEDLTFKRGSNTTYASSVWEVIAPEGYTISEHTTPSGVIMELNGVRLTITTPEISADAVNTTSWVNATEGITVTFQKDPNAAVWQQNPVVCPTDVCWDGSSRDPVDCTCPPEAGSNTTTDQGPLGEEANSAFVPGFTMVPATIGLVLGAIVIAARRSEDSQTSSISSEPKFHQSQWKYL